MENEQPSAQAIEQTQAETQPAGGIQQRIDELTAYRRQAEEQSRKLQEEILKQTSEKAELAQKYAELAQRASAPAPAAPVDPLAGFRDQLDPVAAKAMEAWAANLSSQFEAKLAAERRQVAIQNAALQVRAEVAQVPNLPPEVAQEAERLMQFWRSQGFDVPNSADAVDIALGKYTRNQLRRAAPVMGYTQQNTLPAVVTGQPPAPPAPRGALPSNFDSLSPGEQYNILDKNGVGDIPF